MVVEVEAVHSVMVDTFLTNITNPVPLTIQGNLVVATDRVAVVESLVVVVVRYQVERVLRGFGS